MAEPRKNIKKQIQETTFQQIEKLHPHKLFLYLAMLGSSLIFIFMLTAYTTSKPEGGQLETLGFPKAFVISSFIIMVSSYTISLILKAFKDDNLKKLRDYLGYTLLLGIAFTISQYIGGRQLMISGIYMDGEPAGAYLYVISGLHIFHLLVGLFFVGYLYFRVSKIAKDPIKSLIMVTNPYEKLKLEMVSTYWHYMDVLWILLFFYFFLSY